MEYQFSIKGISKLAFPILFSNLIESWANLIDRLFLARYTAEALNQATLSIMIYQVLLFWQLNVAYATQAFIGRYLGSKRESKIGPLIWQMVYFFLFFNACLWPFIPFLTRILLPHNSLGESSQPFLAFHLAGCVLFPLSLVLNSFFFGLNYYKIVVVVSIIGLVAHCLIDYLFIFGVPGWIPELGIMGSAIGLYASLLICVIIQFTLFSSKRYQHAFNTHIRKFDWKQLKLCLLIGIPQGFGIAVIFLGLAVASYLLSFLEPIYLLCYSTGLLFIFIFIGWSDSLQQAMVYLSSFAVAKQRFLALTHLIGKLVGVFCIIELLLFFPLYLYAPDIISFLFAGSIQLSELDKSYLVATLHWLWAFFLIDSLARTFIGTLIGLKKTMTIFKINLFSTWVLGFLPIYLWIYLYRGPPSHIWMIFTLVTIFNLICYSLKYLQTYRKHFASIT